MSKIILITHQKGGVGKSTITYNMANSLKDDANVAICDLDYQGSLYNSRNYSDVPVYSPDEFEKAVNSGLDFLFVDTPPYLTDKLPELAKMADAIIIPTKVGFYDFLAISETVNIIKNQGKEKQTLIVFNMVKPNTSLTAEMQSVISDFGIPVSENHLSDLVAFTRSGISGIPVHDKARQQIDALTIEVLKILQN